MKQKEPIKKDKDAIHAINEAVADINAVILGETPPSVKNWASHIQQHWNEYAFIARGGHVYKLTNEKRKKSNGAYYSPCDLCELKDDCDKGDYTPCNMLGADTDEYFYDAGELVINEKGMRIEPWWETEI